MRPVEVGGVTGYWVRAGHVVIYSLPAGGEAPLRSRLAGNALIFEPVRYHLPARVAPQPEPGARLAGADGP